MAYDSTIPSLSNLIGDDIPQMQENFQLLEDSQVVDEGSTADGDYIRYENGWQICWNAEYSITLDTSRNDHFEDVVLPNDFLDDSYIAKIEIDAETENWEELDDRICTTSTRDFETNGFTFIIFKANGNDFDGTSGSLHYFAIGRWK